MSAQGVAVFLHNLLAHLLPTSTTSQSREGGPESNIFTAPPPGPVERGDIVVSTASQPAEDLRGIRVALEAFYATARSVLDEAEALRECRKTVVFSKAVGEPLLQFGRRNAEGQLVFEVSSRPTIEDLLAAEILFCAPRDVAFSSDPSQFQVSKSVHIVCNSSHPTRPLQMLFKTDSGHYYRLSHAGSLHNCHHLTHVETLELQ
jgi:hypothetical protein